MPKCRASTLADFLLDRFGEKYGGVEYGAMRRLVEIHAGPHGCAPWDLYYGEEWPCDSLRLLAVPYAAHPGYRDLWRPDLHPGWLAAAGDADE